MAMGHSFFICAGLPSSNGGGTTCRRPQFVCKRSGVLPDLLAASFGGRVVYDCLDLRA
jgi:hypothetical protein